MPSVIKAHDIPSKHEDVYEDDILNRRLLFNPLAGRGLVVVGRRGRRILDCCDGLSPISKIARLENLPVNKIIPLVEKLAHQGILSINNSLALSTNPIKAGRAFRTWIHLTNDCNLACHYCYIRKDALPMTKKVARTAIDLLNDSVLKHQDFTDTLRYVISGGEPLTNLSVLKEFLEYSKFVSGKTGIRRKVSLLTNGTIFSPGIVSLLKKHSVGISISLDGLGEANGHRVFPGQKPSVDVVLKNINRFSKLGIRPYILITITSENFNKLSALTHYLMRKNLGFRYSLLTDLETGKDISSYSPKIINKLNECFDLIERAMVGCLPRHWLNINFQTISLRGGCTRACGIGHSFLAISHDGKAHLCHTDINKKKPVADINNSEDLLSDLWNQNILPELRAYKGIQDYQECSKCYWRFQCGGSCPRFTKIAKGRLNTNSPYCDIIKVMIPRVLRIRALNLIRKEVRESESVSIH